MSVYPVLSSNYGPIDPIIDEWAAKHSFLLHTDYQEVETRHIYIVDQTGERSHQIWIDPLDDEGNTAVHMWEIKKLIRDKRKTKAISLPATTHDLASILDQALELTRMPR